MIPYAVESPRPVPLPIAFVVKNGSNTRARVSASMPLPVSATESDDEGPGAPVLLHAIDPDHEPATAGHRVAGVDRQVEQDALELAAVDRGRSVIGARVHLDVHFGREQPLQDRQQRVDGLLDVGHRSTRRPGDG